MNKPEQSLWHNSHLSCLGRDLLQPCAKGIVLLTCSFWLRTVKKRTQKNNIWNSWCCNCWATLQKRCWDLGPSNMVLSWCGHGYRWDKLMSDACANILWTGNSDAWTIPVGVTSLMTPASSLWFCTTPANFSVQLLNWNCGLFCTALQPSMYVWNRRGQLLCNARKFTRELEFPIL